MKTEVVEFSTILNTIKTKARIFVNKGRHELGYVDVDLAPFANNATSSEAFEMLVIKVSVGILRTTLTQHQNDMLRLTITNLLK